ncbi:MAG: 2-oxoacid:acceptor oxidoreductase subunit alpha [Actinomycetia bacterium]|nr:2-oxoacid:acceptor oxidoreductase subunit alpha [Actinomycetes bacterium]MCP4084229.1 2-oxoacid:acceptor oxidoreductase subunit alpha [Actinomycetes bacterium]
MTDTADRSTAAQSIDRVVIRLAGDSGDGMQLTGDRFTSASAVFGNDLATLPDFPSEIRAPAGTVAGVSAFQIHISDHDIHTPGDAPNVLVAMNPAALLSELHRLEKHGTVILNSDAFDERSLAKAGFEADPRGTDTLADYKVIEVPMTSLTKEAVVELDVKARDAERSKNFFALGIISWLYSRPVEPTLEWIDEKFGKNELVRLSNLYAFNAGHAFGETAELFDHPYQVGPAEQEPGTYRSVNGATAVAWGMVASGQLAKLPVFLGSYPITPATDILHELSIHKNFGVRTLQVEDEIAGIGAALGAAFGGHLAYTTTSGPGVALKGETIGLAVSLELPLVIVDIQRGGPSTGLPTKTEQSDLLMAMFGRHGESPIPVVAAYSPSNCFHAAIEASRLALKYRTPVILLSDGYLANGTEPWLIPEVDSLPDISTEFAMGPNHTDDDDNPVFWPYKRDPETLARAWAIPGTDGLMHRVGGIEKEDGSGNISYDADNHGLMVDLRAEKIDGIVNDIPDALYTGGDNPDVLVVGWGSTYGAITSAAERARAEGKSVGHLHLTHLNPIPANVGEHLKAAKRVLVTEMNKGQLAMILRAKYLVDCQPFNKVKGQPFTAAEIETAIDQALQG